MNIFATALFGPLVAGDFPYIFKEGLVEGVNIPQTWYSSGSLGEPKIFTLWSWPLDLLFGIGASLGLNFTILEILLGFLPVIFIGAWSILKLLDYLKINNLARTVGLILYLANTYILLIIDGGQLRVALAYSLMPVVFLSGMKSLEAGVKEKILTGMLVIALGFFDIRFIYIFAIFLATYFIFALFTSMPDKRKDLLKEWLKLCGISLLMFIGANLFWIIPATITNNAPLPTIYTRESQISFLNFTELKHSLYLVQPHWYQNIFGRIPPFSKEFFFIPVLVFLAPFLRPKNRMVWFWTVVAGIGVFLAKGANPPLGQIYEWLFIKIPGFSMFRDSTKFFFLIALSYSVLISITIDEISRRYPKLKILFPGVIALYLLFLIRPVYLGQMTGIFSEPRYRDEYYALAKKVEEDDTFGRILWIPRRAPLGFASPLHEAIEASRIESLRPFAAGTVGTFETQNFIREGSYVGELFDVIGIKYLAYPYFDPKRDDMNVEKVKYYNTFLGQISGLSWIEKKISDIPIPVLKTKENKNRFFIAGNTYLILGSDRIYSEMAELGAKFSDNALVFIEESPEILKNLNTSTIDKIILYGKRVTDLAVAGLDASDFIFPAQSLDFDPDETGWWKRDTADLVWWRGFLQEKYGLDNLDFDFGGGWAIAEGERQLSITNSLFSKGDILLARVMKSPKGGKVEFFQSGEPVGEIDTNIEFPEKVTLKLTGYGQVPDRFLEYDKADFLWEEIGILNSDRQLEIRAKGDINVVNALVSIDPEKWASALSTTKRIRQDKGIEWETVSEKDLNSLFKSEYFAQATYTSLSPTHYKVKVSGLSTPSTLVFSETFDPQWMLNNASGYKLFSLINGFEIDKDGEYDIYYQPQKYVVPGLVISFLTLGGAVFLLYNLNRRDKGTPKNRDN